MLEQVLGVLAGFHPKIGESRAVVNTQQILTKTAWWASLRVYGP